MTILGEAPVLDCIGPHLDAHASAIESGASALKNMSVPPFGARVRRRDTRRRLRVANALGTNLRAHSFEFWCSISVYGFDHRLRTLEIPERCKRILLVAVTNWVRHRKLRTIIVKDKAIPFGVNTLT